jgi:RNA polymerase sigma-70 factor (ECF subfamily)
MNNNIDREKKIIQEIQQGNYQLFAELIHSYQSPLYNFIFRIVHNRDDALDITQDTFFKAYCSIKSFRFKSKFSTWLFQIGYHESINVIKKHARRREIEKKIQLGIASDEYTEHVEKDELNEKIEKFLNKLKEKQRIALHLLYNEEKSYKEIARIMGLPMNTVKTHIRRGKEALKQMLSEIYDPETMLA